MSARPEFSDEHAKAYDQRWKALAPMMQGLHFLTGVILNQLPENAHVLSVGAGTGAEILNLAEKFPGCRFTAVDTSGDMLEICRAKMIEHGFEQRCRYHVGPIDTLAGDEKFDAATAILVSQFITDDHERRKFFKSIAERLKPDCYLINADLSMPETTKDFELKLEVWVEMLRFAGFTQSSTQQVAEGWKKNISFSTNQEMASLLASSGLENPTLFYQSLFICGWFSKRSG